MSPPLVRCGSLERGVSAQVSSSSSDRCSNDEVRPKIALVLLQNGKVNVTKLSSTLTAAPRATGCEPPVSLSGFLSDRLHRQTDIIPKMISSFSGRSKTCRSRSRIFGQLQYRELRIRARDERRFRAIQDSVSIKQDYTPIAEIMFHAEPFPLLFQTARINCRGGQACSEL
ncbi:hypothetical protein AVEN_73187-1 [Araneus ventricosus]|uniref:Uncharacterized protein n=1 Tax=Araneus ventricosus TaxID=182803 RepID=A0A4Y2KBP9_ARAVE|nr:hypothetical protein AVEN_73187-1 [Araneus ventricosus]